MSRIICALFFCGAQAVAGNNATGPGKWEQCIGDEIAKCMSCVLEEAAHVVETVISISEGDEFEAVSGVLESIKTALECVDDCKAASTKLVAQKCKSWYCTTDFCLVCCGAGSWQCIGNDFHPQCAPKENNFADDVSRIAQEPPRRVEIGLPSPTNTSSEVTPCTCGPGSGDPDSCCSKCSSSKDPHSVPHCPGGGKNTGPFCGNDFHVTEPNACYGETPLCCTNDVGMPVCCKQGQVCDSPLVGDNHCKDPFEAVVV